MALTPASTDKIYIAEVNSYQLYKNLEENDLSYLIDVRTDLEWSQVGVPSLKEIGKELFKISWRLMPDMSINPIFIENFCAYFPLDVNSGSNFYFICRSGARSAEAASMIWKLGYKNCFNVSSGFEGKNTVDSHLNGWLDYNLPVERV